MKAIARQAHLPLVCVRRVAVLLTALLGLALLPTTGQASEPESKPGTRLTAERSAKAPASRKLSRKARSKAAPVTRVAVTGTHIEQPVGPDGTVAPMVSPLTVITSRDIEKMGAATVGQALLRGTAGVGMGQ